jgi:hypothetical protein
MDQSFSSVDVLCGKGPLSFHHGMLQIWFIFCLFIHASSDRSKSYIKVLLSLLRRYLILPAGNVRYREIVLNHIGPYISARSHLDRDSVVQSVINVITSTGGRFLHRVDGSQMVRLLLVVEMEGTGMKTILNTSIHLILTSGQR